MNLVVFLHVVALVMVTAGSPITLFTVGLAPDFAVGEGTDCPHIPLDNEVVAFVVIAKSVVPGPVQPPSARLPPTSTLPEQHTGHLPPKLSDGHVVASLPVQLPGILDTGVNAPGDDGPVPLLATHSSAAVAQVLIHPVHPTHVCVVLLDHIRLLHLNSTQ